jgi:hypothetical protein
MKAALYFLHTVLALPGFFFQNAILTKVVAPMKSLLRRQKHSKDQDGKGKPLDGHKVKDKAEILRLSQMIFLEKRRRMRL